MKPYEIVTRRITVFNGQLAEIPPDAPASVRTWTCHAFFAPGAQPDDLRKKIKLLNIDVTQVEGGCWVYGGHFWLERTRKDLGVG
jgi:hypothetical protein